MCNEIIRPLFITHETFCVTYLNSRTLGVALLNIGLGYNLHSLGLRSETVFTTGVKPQ